MNEATATKKWDEARQGAGPAVGARGAQQAVVVGLIALLALFPLLQFLGGGQNYWLHMLLYTFMYIAMASGWNIIGGYAGYVSLGHNVFFAVGGYFSAVVFVNWQVPPYYTTVAAGLVAMLLGVGFGVISLRTRGPTFIISTIALSMLFKITFDNWEYIGSSDGLSLPLTSLSTTWTKVPFYYGMLLIAMAAVYTSFRVRHSKFGLGLRAISQDELKAEVAGIPTRYYKVLAFALSGFFVGMTGSMWGYYLSFLRPSIFLTIQIAAKLVLMTVLGGKGTVSGPVVGAVVFIVINEFFLVTFGTSELNIVATGVLLAVVLLFFPGGIVGTLKEKGWLPSFLDWD